MSKTTTNDKKVMRIYAIGVIVIALLLGIAVMLATKEPTAQAQVSSDSAVSLSMSEKALDKILGALGLGLGLGSQEAEVAIGGTNPDIPSTYLKWGQGFGVRLYASSLPLTTSTTTVCAIQSPAATSTLQSGGVLFTTSSTTAAVVTLAKATTAFATTTVIGNEYTIAADGQALIIASTTPTDGVTVFAPSSWFVVGMQGAPDFYSPVGRCHATFEEYSI